MRKPKLTILYSTFISTGILHSTGDAHYLSNSLKLWFELHFHLNGCSLSFYPLFLRIHRKYSFIGKSSLFTLTNIKLAHLKCSLVLSSIWSSTVSYFLLKAIIFFQPRLLFYIEKRILLCLLPLGSEKNELQKNSVYRKNTCPFMNLFMQQIFI